MDEDLKNSVLKLLKWAVSDIKSQRYTIAAKWINDAISQLQGGTVSEQNSANDETYADLFSVPGDKQTAEINSENEAEIF
jgi:hypothetical protein